MSNNAKWTASLSSSRTDYLTLMIVWRDVHRSAPVYQLSPENTRDIAIHTAYTVEKRATSYVANMCMNGCLLLIYFLIVTPHSVLTPMKFGPLL